MTAIDQPKPAENYDGIRYQVPSATKPHEAYCVELDSYSGNGECSCPSFDFRLRPLLARLYTPERAVKEGLIKLKPGQRIADALRCRHIIEARQTFTDDVVAAIAAKHKRHDRTP